MTVEDKTYNGDAVSYSGTPVAATETSEEVTIDAGAYKYTWYRTDGNTDTKLSEAPSAAGSYKLVVSADTDLYTGSMEIPFEITPRRYETPEFWIDYINEKLIADVSGQSYKWSCGTESGTVIAAEISIKEEFFGTTITVMRVGTGNYSDSETRTIEIPDRPTLNPGAFTVKDESVSGKTDGSIIPVSKTITYQYKNGGIWTDFSFPGLTNLADGEYQVRQAAIKNSGFASEPLTLTVKESAARKTVSGIC